MTQVFLGKIYLNIYILLYSSVTGWCASEHLNQYPTDSPNHSVITQQPSEPPTRPSYFDQKVFFAQNSAALSAMSRHLLAITAQWLREHQDDRIVIVGLCDLTGSERCDHSLAKSRAAAVEEFLLAEGVQASQIEAVLGWEGAKNEEGCATTNRRCQRLNRTARLFIAGSLAATK